MRNPIATSSLAVQLTDDDHGSKLARGAAGKIDAGEFTQKIVG